LIWAAFPPLSGKNLQKTASKSLLEMLQNTHKMSKKFCFYTEIFYIKNLQIKVDILVTYLRQVSYRKWNEMTAIYQIQIKRQRVCASFGWKLL
jgi:hypothetical protein